MYDGVLLSPPIIASVDNSFRVVLDWFFYSTPPSSERVGICTFLNVYKYFFSFFLLQHLVPSSFHGYLGT